MEDSICISRIITSEDLQKCRSKFGSNFPSIIIAMDTVTKLFRIRRTCLEMLRDRGYLVSEVGPEVVTAADSMVLKKQAPQDELNQDKVAFRERYGENPRKDDLTILVPRQDDPTEQVRAGRRHAWAAWRCMRVPLRRYSSSTRKKSRSE